MIECPQCRCTLGGAGQACAGCGFVAPMIDGFRVWSPELARSASGAFFDPAGFDTLAALEDANFWFQARNELILWALQRHFGAPRRYAEIGCGTGYVLAAVERKLHPPPHRCGLGPCRGYLARKDASVLTLFGAGALAPHFAQAHAAVRPIKTVRIVNRNVEKDEAVAAELRVLGFDAAPAPAEDAVRGADIVTCITNATAPLFKGDWLKPGAHVDLVGAYKPTMREADADTVRRARVYVDTCEGARAEAGDLIQAEAEGAFSFSDIRGDLAQLCKGEAKGRTSAGEITLFKSSGTALEDLAAAVMVHMRSV